MSETLNAASGARERPGRLEKWREFGGIVIALFLFSSHKMFIFY